MADFPDRVVVAGLALLSVIGPCVLSLAPRPSHNVAVVYGPWIATSDALSRSVQAGATLVRAGRPSFVVVVHPVSETFVGDVRRLGAILVLDADSIGCDGSKS